MGIKGLFKVLEENAPNSLITIDMDTVRGYRVAVDASIFFYKNIKAQGDEWLTTFMNQFLLFKAKGLRMIAVFDGPNVPKEKKLEQLRRREQWRKVEKKLDDASKLLKEVEEITSSGKPISKMKLSADTKQRITTCMGPKVAAKVDFNDPMDVQLALARSVRNWTKTSTPVTEQHKLKAIEFLDKLGVPYIQAEGEAETLCCYLCAKGYSDAVLTEDTDVLSYGVKMMLCKVNIKERTFMCIIMDDLLLELDMAQEELRDLCILLGCDYNHSRCKGYPPDGKKRKSAVGIGEKGAMCMIREYRRIEQAEPHIVDTDCLNYRRCRELLTVPKKMKEAAVLKKRGYLMRKPDVDGLLHFAQENNAHVHEENVRKSCSPVKLVLCDE